jgi:hypothetical protein
MKLESQSFDFVLIFLVSRKHYIMTPMAQLERDRNFRMQIPKGANGS